MNKLSVVIPCYNEAASLSVFYDAVTAVCKKLPCDYSLLFVDDGSEDESLSMIKSFSEKDSHVSYLSLSRNFGKEAAMYAGFCNADGDYTAVMDADLQDPPELLPQMLEILTTENVDCVAAKRIDRRGEPPVRSWFAGKFYHLFQKMAKIEIGDGARDYRLMKREMVEAVVQMGESNRFSKGLFHWIGFKTYWLPFENARRLSGKSKWRFRSLVRYAVGGIIDFSQVPLNLSSWLGMLMTLISFLALIFIVVRKLIFGDPVAGWASTICIIVFIGGIQLFCIGLMGQYIARIYLETKNRPHYIVSETNIREAQRIK